MMLRDADFLAPCSHFAFEGCSGNRLDPFLDEPLRMVPAEKIADEFEDQIREGLGQSDRPRFTLPLGHGVHPRQRTGDCDITRIP